MSESGHDSDYSVESGESDDSSVETIFTDNPHSSDEGLEEVGYSDIDSEDDNCEDILRRRKTNVYGAKRKILEDQPQTYAPERWPPLIDFLFVFSSFVAAAVAAYFTIF